MIAVFSTLLGYSIELDFLVLKFGNGNLLLRDFHEEDCVEDVAVDWDEIPAQWLDGMVGKFILRASIEKQDEGGFLLHLQYEEEEDAQLPEELRRDRASLLIGCHDIQNGCYSSNLEVTMSYKSQQMCISDLEFTRVEYV